MQQRVARAGKGRSGGYGTILAYGRTRPAVFLYGFAKSERQNIGPEELKTAREIAAIWLSSDDRKIALGLEQHELEEIADAITPTDTSGSGAS